MASTQRAKVIVAGGGVAGLAIANMLEQADIDYVVLEKYGDIAPSVGASIGIFPNGCRILDQLGCYDKLEALVAGNMGTDIVFRDQNGKKTATAHDFNIHMKARFGYKGLWLDRQTVLQILYDNLKDKSKILVNQGLVRVDQQSDRVQVVTTDGSIFIGDMLVGADGFHSAARREMWRIADEECPKYFPVKEREAIPCDYSCVFGISSPPAGFEFAVCDNIMGEDYSHIFATGPEKRVYWFLFSKRPTRTCGLYENAPRYTEADKNNLVKTHFHDAVSECLTFKDIWDARSFSTLVTIPEGVFTKWHYGRIITVGDAAHKFNPMIGQGGNCAIETCTVLVNNLYQLLESKGKDYSITLDELTDIYRRTQATQHARVLSLMRESHIFQSIQASDNSVSRMLAKVLPFLADTDLVTALFTDRSIPGPKLNMIDVPARRRHESYLDERASRPILSWIPLIIAATLSILMLFEFNGSYPSPNSYTTTFCAVEEFISGGLFNIREAIAWVASLPENGTQTEIFGFGAQSTYLTIVLLPLLVNWTIDGYRYSNKQAIVFRYISTSLCLVLGVRIVGPIHYLASIWNTKQDLNGGRAVPTAIAAAILPSIILGYAIPTLFLLTPFCSEACRMSLAAAWPLLPAVVTLMVHFLSKTMARNSLRFSASPDPHLAQYSRKDLPYLHRLYLCTFFLALIAHCAYLTHLAHYSHSFFDIVGNFIAASQTLSLKDISESVLLSSGFNRDLYSAISLIFIYCVYWILELRNRGLITSRMTIAALATFILAQAIVGPGAAYIGIWSWREGVLAASSRLDDQVAPAKAKKHNGAIPEKVSQSECDPSRAAFLR